MIAKKGILTAWLQRRLVGEVAPQRAKPRHDESARVTADLAAQGEVGAQGREGLPPRAREPNSALSRTFGEELPSGSVLETPGAVP